MTPVRALRHSLTLTWRSLTKIRHSPELLLDVIMLPIVFVVLFVFLFGTAIAGDWHTYLQYVLPGIAVQALLFGSLGTALAITTDRRQGLFDRLRSLPIARSAPLFGHVLGDVVKSLVSLLLVFGFGAALGFRTHASWLSVLGGFALIVLFAVAMCWVAALIGMASTTVGTVQALGIVVIIPLTFGSNVFVPTGRLPGWLQAWVKINPVTQLSDAARALMLHRAAGHAVAVSLVWALGILAVCAPAAVLMFRRTSR
jgi:oleandomycin transport system permease protein